MTPGRVDTAQAAHLLHASPRLLELMVQRDLIPHPDKDGSYDPHDLNRARMRHPWMRYLDTPMSERELARIDRGLFIPPGVGFDQEGRRYARLSDVLEAFWGRM